MRFLRIFVLSLSAIAATVRPADATSIALNLTSGTSSVTLFSNGTVLTSGSVTTITQTASLGLIQWTGQIGSWTVNVTTGIGTSVLGPGILELNTVNVSGVSPATLGIAFSQTGNTVIFPGFQMNIGGVLSSNFTQAQYTTFSSNTNTLFAQTNQIGQLTFNQSGAFSGTTSALVSVGAPYSLTQLLSITSAGGVGSFSANAQLAPIPEPASLLLLGGGLSGVALLTRARRKKARKSATP